MSPNVRFFEAAPRFAVALVDERTALPRAGLHARTHDVVTTRTPRWNRSRRDTLVVAKDAVRLN
jgi:hypothetical protein